MEKNLWIVLTDKASRLGYWKGNYNLHAIAKTENICNRSHIYITSDEKVKDNDWVLHIGNKTIFKYTKGENEFWKKIILTTDQDLIKDGVQSIDNDFLKWFVNNPTETIKVKKEYITPLGDVVETCYDNERLRYKIKL